MRIVIGILVVVLLLAAWSTYDNVLTDIAPTQALAVAEACRVRACKEPPAVTRIARSAFGQSFDFESRDARPLRVTCRRSMLFGATTCTEAAGE